MDFEEQLEKAEKLSSPSLVGSSIRSADDSPHNNYIHPEKYRSSGKLKSKNARSKLHNLTTSLDDLISEGALLGSEEDFERFLDNEGQIKDDAKYLKRADSKSWKEKAAAEETEEKGGKVEGEKEEEGEEREETKEDKVEEQGEKSEDKQNKDTEAKAAAGSSSFYKQEDYSTPNLSEYQLEHQIKDHQALLTNIQSFDPHRLPSSTSYKDGVEFKKPTSSAKKSAGFSPSKGSIQPNDGYSNHIQLTKDGLHSPYFQTDIISRSRSRSLLSHSNNNERSRSRSSIRPHLARGDSYKNTNDNEPSKYELPPDLAATQDLNEEDEIADDRISRQSKPTMGESIAAAELLESQKSASLTKDPSLLTTGDYTNFNVDTPEPEIKSGTRLFATRSLSSTNYLRSISRSRSRQPDTNKDNEKNDANPGELFKEGAFVTDDPYSTIDRLDTMVEEVLHLEEHEHTDEKDSGEAHSKEISEIKKNDIETEDKREEVEESNVITGENDGSNKESLPKPESTAGSDKVKDEKGSSVIESNTDSKSESEPKSTEDDLDLDNLDISPEEIRKHLESQPIYVFTSLAGGMQIQNRANRLHTILNANGIKFSYRDLGTDEEAKKIWKRQANGKTLPGVVRGDDFIGNWEDIDEANEEYRVRELLYETL